jgi:hypothetical protein
LVTLTAMIDDDRHPHRAGAATSERGGAVLLRDAAIARVGRTRGVVIAGAAALTGAFAALASALAPGHALGANARQSTSAAVASVTGNGQPVMPPLANPATLGLQGAGNAPVSAPSSGSSPGSNQAAAQAAAAAAAPVAVSGGS